MPDKESARVYLALLGDVVGSRAHPQRARLQRRVAETLETVNARVSAVEGLRMTIGDEFQGLYARAADALESSLLIRLLLRPEADVRFGIGCGPLSLHDPSSSPYAQDGPAWWAAREAVEAAAGISDRRETPRGWRTVFRAQLPGDEVLTHGKGRITSAGLEGLVNAHLMCRDELVSGMDERDARFVLALFDGERQVDVASREGVTQSAVAQRNIRSGAYAVREAQRAIGEALTWPS